MAAGIRVPELEVVADSADGLLAPIPEISWQPKELEFCIVHPIHRRTAHVFRSELSVPLEQLRLMEGQDMALVSTAELLAGSIWSSHLGGHRPLADGLLEVMEQLLDGVS